MSNNGIVNIHGKQYVTVAERLRQAHEVSRLQGIATEVLQHEPVVVIKATVNISGVEYTGISSANPAKSIEKSNPYEVAETSAVGRALGFANFGLIDGVASADEMARVEVKEDAATGVIKTSTVEEPPMPEEEMPAGKKICSAHDVPEQMFEGKSKTKLDKDGNPKKYWWHKKGEQMCFGQGYMD